jgi:PhnB protein
MHIQPYLFFNGRCEEAIEFYKTAVGAELQMLLRHKDSPMPPPGQLPPGSEQKIMHAAFRVGDTVVMASDGMCDGKPVFNGFTLSIAFASEAQVRPVFAKLSDGGNIRMPVEKTFWSPAFGMLVDRFGVSWMVTVAP